MIKNWNSYNESHGIDDTVESICNHLKKIRSNFVEFEDSESVISYNFKVVSVDNIYDMKTYKPNNDWEIWINNFNLDFKKTLPNLYSTSYFHLNEKFPFCLIINIKVPLTTNIPGNDNVNRYRDDLIGDIDLLENIIVTINRLKDDYDHILFGLKGEVASVHVYFNT